MRFGQSASTAPSAARAPRLGGSHAPQHDGSATGHAGLTAREEAPPSRHVHAKPDHTKPDDAKASAPNDDARQNEGAPTAGRSRLPRFVEWGLWLLMAGLLARIALLLFAPLPVGDAPALSPDGGTIRNVADGRAPPANPFAFGGPADVQADDGGPPEAIRETDLALKLYGVTILDGEPSRAIIGTPGGKQKSYGIGDAIDRNVLLQSVYPNDVVLRVNGVSEALRLPKENRERPKVAAQGGDVSQNQAATYQGAAANIAEFVSFRPARDRNGEFAISLAPKGQSGLFAAYGLQKGDKLLSVDGARISGGLNSITALSQDMTGKRRVEIIVERGGSPTPITIALDQLPVE